MTTPAPRWHLEPHIYARAADGAVTPVGGACVCGQGLGHPLHTHAAPGVGVPARAREDHRRGVDAMVDRHYLDMFAADPCD